MPPPANPLLSVIVPTLNEEAQIAAHLTAAFQGRPHEVIVCDGQSTDRTQEIARSLGARVIATSLGRGCQLNAGAAAATGDHLLFVHADTALPAGYPALIANALSQPGVSAAAFSLAIDGLQPTLRFIERAVSWRSRVLQMPYGDQALGVTRAMFDRVGGYPEIPAMEDYEMSRRLRRMGRITIVSESVRTSARRWEERGIWRATLFNQVCIAAHRLGVSPERIAAWRARGAGIAKKPDARSPSAVPHSSDA